MGDVREPLRELTSCGLPEALEVMGERWSFMILRASFNGLHHFEEFLSELGIARNILSNRLAKLVEHGILDRQPCPDDRRRIDELDRLPIGPTSILAHDGRVLGPKDLRLVKPDQLGLREDGTRAKPGDPLGFGDVAYLDRVQAAE